MKPLQRLTKLGNRVSIRQHRTEAERGCGNPQDAFVTAMSHLPVDQVAQVNHSAQAHLIWSVREDVSARWVQQRLALRPAAG